jgi:hypothetical protein
MQRTAIYLPGHLNASFERSSQNSGTGDQWRRAPAIVILTLTDFVDDGRRYYLRGACRQNQTGKEEI